MGLTRIRWWTDRTGRERPAVPPPVRRRAVVRLAGRRRPVAPALLICSGLWLGGAGCGEGPPDLVVGSKNFTEQDLLGEIAARWIEARLGLRVERRLHLGGTFIAHRALVTGELDLYVEYTGTAYTAVLERAPTPNPDSVFRAVSRIYEDRWDLIWLPPLGFENTFAMLVRESMADSLGLARLSDVAPHAPSLLAGFGYEFMQREDGYRGLRAAYGLEFAGPPREMDLGLIYRALASGEIDLTAGNSTDGRIEALNLRPLEDDRAYFPPYEAAIVVRRDALERHPGLERALRELSGRIDTEAMRRLNAAVELEGRRLAQVAEAWVGRELP